MTESETEPPSPQGVRTAGACLAVAMLAMVATITVYVTVYGAPEGTGPGGEVTLADRAAHLTAHWSIARPVWIVEAFAMLLLAVAGFGLARREAASPVPAPLGWTALGVGATVNAVMYAFTLGAYPVAAPVVDAQPALMDAANESAVVLFLLGNLAMNAGLAVAFAGEATSARRVIPRALAALGAALALIVAMLAAAGFQLGMDAMKLGAPLAGLVLLIAAIFGWRIAAKG
jgi:hypothetical protein